MPKRTARLPVSIAIQHRVEHILAKATSITWPIAPLSISLFINLAFAILCLVILYALRIITTRIHRQMLKMPYLLLPWSSCYTIVLVCMTIMSIVHRVNINLCFHIQYLRVYVLNVVKKKLHYQGKCVKWSYCESLKYIYSTNVRLYDIK